MLSFLLPLFHPLQISSVQSLSRVQLFATPWIAVPQASMSITISQSSLKCTSIKSGMPSSHLILCRPFSSSPQSLPASEPFPVSQLFAWGGQNAGVSALASFLPKKSQHGLRYKLCWGWWAGLSDISSEISDVTLPSQPLVCTDN